MSYKQKVERDREIIFDIRSEYRRRDSPTKQLPTYRYQTKQQSKMKKLSRYNSFDSL
jgi:hypothetical protein